VERFLLRYMYRREELYQLLFTYALVLIFSDACKYIWGTQPHSVSRPPILSGSFDFYGVRFPHYDLFIILLGPLIAFGFWVLLNRTSYGRIIRAAALDREMLGALGTNVSSLYTGMFVLAAFLAGLSGALVSPIKSVVPGMDVEIIIEAFIVVVIGGLGSLWGTLLGSLIYGMTLAFGILIFPRFSIFAAFVIMAVVLIVRPWGLMGRPIK
jgi:branched-chain amino acid transport system permease protein